MTFDRVRRVSGGLLQLLSQARLDGGPSSSTDAEGRTGFKVPMSRTMSPQLEQTMLGPSSWIDESIGLSVGHLFTHKLLDSCYLVLAPHRLEIYLLYRYK